MTETAPPGTEIRHCPLPDCDWTHALAPVGPDDIAEAALTSPAEAVCRRIMSVEVALEGHLSSHTLLEWVQEIQRLREIAERPRRLVGQWRKAAEAVASTNAAWSSHFYDCANELERLLTP